MADFQKPSSEELDKRFYPAKNLDQIRSEQYEYICKGARNLARVLIDNTPCSPEQMRALNALDECVMLAYAAISRRE